MRFGVNYPQGPFQWMTQMGAQQILMILENLHQVYGEERYRPSLYLRKKVAASALPVKQTQQLKQAG